MNLDELNMAWIQAGQKVTDLQDKSQKMAIALSQDPKAFTEDDVTKVTTDLKAAKTARDFAKNALDDAKATLDANKPTVQPVKPGKTEKDLKHNFANKIRDLLSGKVTKLNLLTSDNDPTKGPAAGVTIPQDVETKINELIRQYDVLQQYVNVEKVSVPSGSRVIEEFATVTPLAELDDETATAPDNDDPKLKTVSYKIKRFIGISTVTDSLIKDSDENILNWLAQWIAKKVVVTRNQAVIGVLNLAPKKPTIAKWDDLIDLSDGTLDPAINNLGIFLTNNSGWNTIKKVKDAMGNYIVSRDPQTGVLKEVNGKQIAVVSDNWLPDVSGAHPLYFGDFKDGVTLFDLENMSLMTTNVGAGSFEKDQTKIRVIDRFDVEMIDDGAFAAGSFKSIADQTASFAVSAPTAPTAPASTSSTTPTSGK